MKSPLSPMLKIACEIYHREKCYKRDLDAFFGMNTKDYVDELFDWQFITAEYCEETKGRLLCIPWRSSQLIGDLYERYWIQERN